MYFPLWLIVIGVIVLFVYLRNKDKKQDVVPPKNVSPSKNEIEEETVLKAQADFEKKLQDNFSPESIMGKYVYIYENIMRPWYDKLSGRYRYDKEATQKLRSDWTDYMGALREQNDCRPLAREEKEGEKRDYYDNRVIMALKKISAIEDAFSSAIGDEAIKELAKIREMDSDSFDSEGKRDRLGKVSKKMEK